MISVVIPTHNRCNLLTRAIESVINQTYKDLQVIVVSDGSTDDTDKVMKGLLECDSRIEYIALETPRGGNAARNRGIEASQGDYIAFLDDDDIWSATKLEKQLDIFSQKTDVGIVYTGIKALFVEENISYESLINKTGDLSRDILLRNYIGTTSTVMVKRKVLHQAGNFDEKLEAQQDYDLWIRICQVTNVGFVNEVCVEYYNYPGTNQISSQIEKYERSMEQIEKKYSNYFFVLTPKELRLKKSNNYLFLSLKALRNNNKVLAFKYSLKSLKVKPGLKSIMYLGATCTSHTLLLKLRALLNA